MRHFRLSLAVTVILLALATWWGYNQLGWRGALSGLWVAIVLGVMEVSLSFDNAVVNASILKNWNRFWQKVFLTVGIVIAVFGMRLLFPLLIVAFATGMGLAQVASMALESPVEYARHLNLHSSQVATFGGCFLLLVFLNFVFDGQKTLHWLGRAEAAMGEFGSEGLAIVIVIAALFGCVAMVPDAARYSVLASGVAGVAIYAAVHWVATVLERGQAGVAHRAVASGSLGGFLYLEVLDASFSFDGVIGAFAITNDVVLIMLGLAIGAAFVRSTTVYLVQEGTLDRFVFLKHGAHYAVGILGVIMLSSVEYDVPEWMAGVSGVMFIAMSLWSSIRYQRKRLPAA